MAEPQSLTFLVEQLKHLALQVERQWGDKAYQELHAGTRAVLSVASRLHARITALIEAQSELYGQNK